MQIPRVLHSWLVYSGKEANLSILQREGGSQEDVLQSVSFYYTLFFFFRINKFLETDFTKKVNVKKRRRFDRLTVIFKLKSKSFACTQIYTIDYKNANDTLTKTLPSSGRNVVAF